MCGKLSGIPGRLGHDAGLLQETEISEPVDEPLLPRAERDAIAVRQPRGHPGTVGQRIPRVTSVAVDVPYPIGDRFTILNRGRSLGTFTKAELSREDLVRMMAGGEELEELGHELDEIARIARLGANDAFSGTMSAGGGAGT